MKRGILFAIIVLSILSIFPATALEIQADDEFQKGSTFLASLQGNILQPISEDNVAFYKAHVQIPVTHGFLKIQDAYYFYAILPYQQGEYNLKIQDVYFKENNQIQTKTLQKNFTITNKTADFNVNPGAIIAKDNFTISIYNSLNNELNLNYEIQNQSNSKIISAQDSEKVFVEFYNIENAEKIFLSLNSDSTSYKIPIYALSSDIDAPIEKNDSEKNQSEEKESILRFSPSSMSKIINKKESYVYDIELSNLGETSGKIALSISDSLEDYLEINKKTIDSLGYSEKQTITLIANFDEKANYTGYIEADSDNSNTKIELRFEVGENLTIHSSPTTEKTCSELEGKVCADNQICTITPVSTSDNLCCLGECEDFGSNKEKKPERNWTAIIIILVIAFVILGFAWWKLRKQKPDAKEILNKRRKSFAERYKTKDNLEN